MRILHVTSEPPGDTSGGKLVVQQSLFALKEFANLDYVGPRIDKPQLDEMYDRRFFLEIEKSIIKRSVAALRMKNPRYHYQWAALRQRIEWRKYEWIIAEFPKLEFVLRDAKAHGIRTMLRIHNIEKDYYAYLLRKQFSVENLLKYAFFRNIERQALRNADIHLFLTQEDRQRAFQIYPDIQNNNSYVVPACVHGPFALTSKQLKTVRKTRLLFTGSLWLPHNNEGILWFVANVWPHIRDFCDLRIAGSQPSIALLKKIEGETGIALKPDPISIEGFFKKTDLVIVPMFSKSGMKVKVAQSFAYGIPVVGTNAAFIGYDIINGKHSFLANNADEFIEAMKTYSALSSAKRKKIRNEIRKFFVLHHSFLTCKKQFRRIFSENKTNS